MSAEKPTPADAWGKQISAERQAELQGYLDHWAAETNRGERRGPFDHEIGASALAGVRLTGSDVFWLAEQSARDDEDNLLNLRIEGADLR
jgi:hypothetical protein